MNSMAYKNVLSECTAYSAAAILLMSAKNLKEAMGLNAYRTSAESLVKEHAGVNVVVCGFGAVEGFKAYVVTARVCTI